MEELLLWAKTTHCSWEVGVSERSGRDVLSEKAQLKLEWIIFYHTVGGKNVTQTARHFSISRKTLHKYLTRFDEKNLTTLEEQSRRPDHTRGWMVTKEEEAKSSLFAKRTWSMERRSWRFCTRKSKERRFQPGRSSELSESTSSILTRWNTRHATRRGEKLRLK